TLAVTTSSYQDEPDLRLDYNDLDDPDVIRIGAKHVVPDRQLRRDLVPPPVVEAPVPRTQQAAAAPAVVQVPVPKPAAPKPAPAPAAPKPAPAAPVLASGGGSGTIVANAMQFVGYRYVFGGTSPSGFDCSGFVYYV